jgi:putative tricarboxylic transport membrane protein
MTTDRASGSVLLMLALGIAWESRRLPLGTHHGPGPGYFPLLLAAALAVLALVVLVRGRAAAPLGSLDWGEAPQAVAVMATAAFAALALERLGYRLTVLVALIFLLGAVERRRLWVVGLVAGVMALGSFWVFDSLLRVPLPRGPLGF